MRIYLRYSEKGKRGLLRPPLKRSATEGHMTDPENKLSFTRADLETMLRKWGMWGKVHNLNKMALADALGG